eukprot:TRINITY_DN14448_c0_g1_i1.p1 TRINITY_DN14448_c0_g1~~TRINITY_DN14448_c0_g1_i1.p1  ORF type:complete len:505 (-),score=120.79 TRINITY_DN14448_c0_g1_i1:20-1474(-)
MSLCSHKTSQNCEEQDFSSSSCDSNYRTKQRGKGIISLARIISEKEQIIPLFSSLWKETWKLQQSQQTNSFSLLQWDRVSFLLRHCSLLPKPFQLMSKEMFINLTSTFLTSNESDWRKTEQSIDSILSFLLFECKDDIVIPLFEAFLKNTLESEKSATKDIIQDLLQKKIDQLNISFNSGLFYIRKVIAEPPRAVKREREENDEKFAFSRLTLILEMLKDCVKLFPNGSNTLSRLVSVVLSDSSTNSLLCFSSQSSDIRSRLQALETLIAYAEASSSIIITKKGNQISFLKEWIINMWDTSRLGLLIQSHNDISESVAIAGQKLLLLISKDLRSAFDGVLCSMLCRAALFPDSAAPLHGSPLLLVSTMRLLQSTPPENLHPLISILKSSLFAPKTSREIPFLSSRLSSPTIINTTTLSLLTVIITSCLSKGKENLNAFREVIQLAVSLADEGSSSLNSKEKDITKQFLLTCSPLVEEGWISVLH